MCEWLRDIDEDRAEDDRTKFRISVNRNKIDFGVFQDDVIQFEETMELFEIEDVDINISPLYDLDISS